MNSLSALIPATANTLAYRVCEPIPTHPTALLVLLHGVGGNETNLAEIAAGMPADTLVVLARGRLSLGPEQYAWFRVAFTAAGPQIVESEADESRQVLIGFIDRLQVQHGIEPARTVVAGFSQGGILSASVGLSAPERVQGFAVLSGRILPELEPVVASPERLAHLRVFVAHGREDDKLPVGWAESAHAWLDKLCVVHELKLYPGGHGLSGAAVRDFQGWVNALLPVQSTEMPVLHLEADATRLSGGAAGDSGLNIAPGINTLLRERLSRPGSLAYGIESAICAIEDQLARVPKAFHGVRMPSYSPVVREIAAAAGLGKAVTDLRRDAVEQVFARQSAVALGRPAASERSPDSLSFIAGLLILRELMHHLDVESVTLTD